MNPEEQTVKGDSAVDKNSGHEQTTLVESETIEQEATMADDQNLNEDEATTLKADELCQSDPPDSVEMPTELPAFTTEEQVCRRGLFEPYLADAEMRHGISGTGSLESLTYLEFCKLAAFLGLPATPDIIHGLWTSNGKLMCEAIRDHKGILALGKLLKALALSKLAPSTRRDKGDTSTPFRNLYGCETSSHLFRLSEQYFDMPEATLRFYMKAGTILEHYLQLFLNGAEGEPGMTLDQIAQNLAKVTLFELVARKRGLASALRAFKELSFREFLAIAKPKVPKKAVAAKVRSATTTVTFLDLDLDKLPEGTEGSEGQWKVLYKIIVTGGNPRMLSSPFPKAFDGLEDAIDERAQQIDATTNASLPRVGEIPSVAEEQVAYAMSLFNPFEIIDLVNKVNREVGPHKRFISVCMARLYHEEVFAPYWKPRYKSFYEFARVELGIDSECRNLLRIGRNISKYPWILRSLRGIDNDTVFLNLRYLDKAMANHAGKNPLIRNKLINLSTREFASFAKNGEYDSELLEKPLNPKQKELFVSFLGRIEMNPAAYKYIHFIEVFSDAELGFALQYVREAEARLQKLSDVTPSTPMSPESEDQPLAA
jgi:hypothetical protein